MNSKGATERSQFETHTRIFVVDDESKKNLKRF